MLIRERVAIRKASVVGRNAYSIQFAPEDDHWMHRLNFLYPPGDRASYTYASEEGYEEWFRPLSHPFLLRESEEQIRNQELSATAPTDIYAVRILCL